MAKVVDIETKQATVYAVPLWLRDEQIRANVRAVQARVRPGPVRAEPIAVVGYGPSLRKTWKRIAQYEYIISCSGATRFLLERGIVSTWHAEVDPREHKAAMITPHGKTEYLLASCVHPNVIQHLKGYNVKLWHVFAKDGESEQVVPRGEWSLTGGTDVGMRCMSLAHFLGFREMHMFGMDGSSPRAESRHAGPHPISKTVCEARYNGKTYYSTPAMMESAKQVFHELDQMPDVTFKFFGRGLIQDMAKTYKRMPPTSTAIGIKKPELISAEYKALNAQLHRDNLMYGVGGGRHAHVIKALAEKFQTNRVLDYGAGKGYLGKSLGFPIYEYDPAIPGKDEPPAPAAIVACTDVLEHIEPDKIDAVVKDLRRVTEKVGYFVINTGPARKTLPDGRNTHLLQRDAKWWQAKLGTYFTIGKIFESGNEIKVVVT